MSLRQEWYSQSWYEASEECQAFESMLARWMDGWKEGRMDGWIARTHGGMMDGWMDGGREGGMMEGWKEGRKDGWMDGWIARTHGGMMDGKMNRYMGMRIADVI